MCIVLEPEPVAVTGGLEPRCAIDENQLVVYPMFLAEFSEKHRRDRCSSRRIQPNVDEVVSIGIDRSVQPISLIIEFDHSFIDCNVIRAGTFNWL